jgi:hypothetical protein
LTTTVDLTAGSTIETRASAFTMIIREVIKAVAREVNNNPPIMAASSRIETVPAIQI